MYHLLLIPGSGRKQRSQDLCQSAFLLSSAISLKNRSPETPSAGLGVGAGSLGISMGATLLDVE